MYMHLSFFWSPTPHYFLFSVGSLTARPSVQPVLSEYFWLFPDWICGSMGTGRLPTPFKSGALLTRLFLVEYISTVYTTYLHFYTIYLFVSNAIKM